MSREGKECEQSLGKPPVTPPQEPNVMNVSDSVVKRINTGAVDEERRNAYDNYWIDKLSCMDKAHSINSKLDIGEIESIEKRLRQYALGGRKKCPLDRTRVTQCYVYNRKETLKCSRDVETFLHCVDNHLYRAVRSSIDNNESKYSKHASYAEQFKRGF